MTEQTRQLATHVLTTQYTDISNEALEAARIFFLDTLGVGIAGAIAPYAAEMRDIARSWGQGDVQASVLGCVERLPPPAAAWVNGFQIHCQEFDCVHEPAVVHPMATIFAALMAEAERQGAVSGPEFLVAQCVAVDVAAGLGVAARSPIRFFRPATAGLFGATAGIARLRGFSQGELLNAWGYALAQAAGTMQAHVEGTPTLPVQIAAAARAAHVACDVTQAGIPGPVDSLQGPFGYLSLFELETDWAAGFGALGKVWRMAEVSHKPFPTGRAAQGGIAGLQQLITQHGLSGEQIAHLELNAPPLIKRLVGRPVKADLEVNYARLCFAYLAATVLETGTVALQDFTADALCAPSRLALAEKVSVIENDVSDPAAFTPQTLTATLTDGRKVTTDISDLPGAPSNPLTREQHLSKFRTCIAYVSDTEVVETIQRVDRLEQEPDIGVFARIIQEQRR